MQTIVIALQNAVEFRDLGVATSSNTFFRSLGSAFGTALFGSIFSNRAAHYIQSGLAGLAAKDPKALADVPAGALKQITNNTSVLKTLPPAVRDSILHSFVQSFHVVFYAAAPVTALGFVIALFLRETKLRTGAEHHAAQTEAAGEALG